MKKVLEGYNFQLLYDMKFIPIFNVSFYHIIIYFSGMMPACRQIGPHFIGQFYRQVDNLHLADYYAIVSSYTELVGSLKNINRCKFHVIENLWVHQLVLDS